MKSNGSNKIGLYLMKYRFEKQITQQEVADKLGCSRETVCRIEKNKLAPGTALTYKIIKLIKTLDN